MPWSITWLHVDQRKLTLYRGGYTAFERARAERLAQQQQAYEKQQAQRAHMESYIARFKAQATKARQAQSRIKALERMEELSAAHVDSPFDFVFRESRKSPARCSTCPMPAWVTATNHPGEGQAAADPGRAHRPARPQRRRQVDPDQEPRR
jgi:ATPase subunit of ABC transporter with duplicated ATPase domains